MMAKSRNTEFQFKIKEASEQVGVVPATIRNWEKAGVINVKYTRTGYRVFTLDDIELLKKIKKKSEESKLHLNELREMFNPNRGEDFQFQNRSRTYDTSTASKRFLGSKWKQCRLEKGYNLEEVASHIGISASYLSKIENGGVNVSFEVLKNIAAFYGENILYYLQSETKKEPGPYLRSSDMDIIPMGIEGLEIREVVPLTQSTINVLHYTIQPGVSKCNNPHSGEEVIYAIKGSLTVTLDNEDVYVLSEGDSLTFSSKKPHSWINSSGEVTECLWIYTPLVK